MYIDWEGDWFIEFTARCRHLTAENTCGIYEERPKICSDFSWDECEVSTKERAWKYRFDSYPDFLKWLEERRPKSYEKYVRARRQLIRKRQQKARKAAPPTAEPSAAEAGA